MKNITKITALITSTLLFGAVAGPANAAPLEPTVREAKSVERTYQPVVTAVPASLNFEKPAIKTVAAPVPEPEPEPIGNKQSGTSPAVKAPTTATPTTAVKPSTALPTASNPQTLPITAPASGKGAALLAAARGQIGQIQDCTAMVERALGSLGIVTGDLAPAQFFRFGSVVGTPAPGDIIISAGHVGIYSGNGMMVSGGFNGNQTVEHPISYVGGFSAVRVA